MSTIPDDRQPGYDHGPALAALRLSYPEWVIGYEAALHIYSAELRSADGRSLHYLCGHDIGELAARLATATALDSGTVQS